jgi:hypothetical protein
VIAESEIFVEIAAARPRQDRHAGLVPSAPRVFHQSELRIPSFVRV